MVRAAVSSPLLVLPRATVALDEAALSLTTVDGHTRHYELDGCAVLALDATCARRFVRMLILERGAAEPPTSAPAERLTIITPPDEGAIAPSAARVMPAPADAVVISSQAWETLASWLAGGGRLAACSMLELARLATIASPRFALVIGEVAAELAMDAAWARVGPLRGGHSPEDSLRPLYEASRDSAAAEDAWVAALARANAPRARRATGT